MVRCTIFIWNIQYDACVTDFAFFLHNTNVCVYVLQGHTATFSPIMLRISIISHEQVYYTAAPAAAAAATFACHSFQLYTKPAHISSLWKKNYCYLNFILSIPNDFEKKKRVHNGCTLFRVYMHDMRESAYIKARGSKTKTDNLFHIR